MVGFGTAGEPSMQPLTIATFESAAEDALAAVRGELQSQDGQGRG